MTNTPTPAERAKLLRQWLPLVQTPTELAMWSSKADALLRELAEEVERLQYRFDEQVRDKTRILDEYEAQARSLRLELAAVNRDMARIVYACECGKCGSTSLSLVDMTLPLLWNCDNCKHRWPVNQQSQIDDYRKAADAKAKAGDEAREELARAWAKMKGF